MSPETVRGRRDKVTGVRDLGVLLTPLLRDGQHLEAVTTTLTRWLEAKWIVGVPALIDLLETGLGDRDLPEQALTLGRALRQDTNPLARTVGIVILSGLRGSPEACVEVAEARIGGDLAAEHIAERVIQSRNAVDGVVIFVLNTSS